jgi:hypothetical protein
MEDDKEECDSADDDETDINDKDGNMGGVGVAEVLDLELIPQQLLPPSRPWCCCRCCG